VENNRRRDDAAPLERRDNLPHPGNWHRWRPVFAQVLPWRSQSAATVFDPNWSPRIIAALRPKT